MIPNGRTRVDLHCHTNRSDGTSAPADLYRAMTAAGMTLVAITDHDTFAGVRALREAGVGGDGTDGPVLIPGLEINAAESPRARRAGLGRDDAELHLLGYGIDIDAPAINGLLATQRRRRRERILEMAERLIASFPDLPIEPARLDALPEGSALGRPALAAALVAGGRAATMEAAFHDYLSPGSPWFLPRRGIDALEAVSAIRADGGIAVLAHPFGLTRDPDAIDPLIEAGLAGLEVHYRAFPDEAVTELAAIAARKGLLATGGSDYHGHDEPRAYADWIATARVPDAVGSALLAAIAA